MTIQLPQGYNVADYLGLPVRVSNIENSLSSNWKEHDGFRSSANTFSRRISDLWTTVNDLISRVTSLEAGRVQPGGGGAGLTGAQTSDLAWLHAQRPNIVLKSDLAQTDVITQVNSYMEQTEFYNKLQPVVNSFIVTPGSTTRSALFSYNSGWWRDLDISSKVDVDYLRSKLDRVYVDLVWMKTFSDTVFDNKQVGLNTLKNRIDQLQSRVEVLEAVTKKISDIKSAMSCLKTAVQNVRNNLNPDSGCFRKVIQDFQTELKNEWNAVTPGINSAEDWTRIIGHFVQGLAKCIRDSMASMETCLTDIEKKL